MGVGSDGETMLAYVIQGIAYGFAAGIQPGPFQTYVVSQTLRSGWRRTLPAALAPLVSDGPIIALALLVLSAVPSWLIRFLNIAGGLFVLYLAVGTLRACRSSHQKDPPRAGSGPQSLLKAATMNALSPGPYLFWTLVTGPILVNGWRESPVNGIGLLVGFYLAMSATLATLILLFGIAARLGPRLNRALAGLSAVALLAFGLYQLWQGVSGLVMA